MPGSTSTTTTTVDRLDVARKVVHVAGEGEVPGTARARDRVQLRRSRRARARDLGGLYYVKNIREAMEWDKVLDTVKVGGRRGGIAARRRDGDRARPPGHRDPPGRSASVAAAEMADPDIMAPVEESWRELGVTTHFNTTLKAFVGDGSCPGG